MESLSLDGASVDKKQEMESPSLAGASVDKDGKIKLVADATLDKGKAPSLHHASAKMGHCSCEICKLERKRHRYQPPDLQQSKLKQTLVS
ncbi:hypothetical protein RJT34_07122 [Clitoria ternatea]|uniref:Uncharacterized protein n=1 Tax=Clitoria ternatea TaxID=43366 RepID=A0AAN9K4E4_CLITE